MEKAKVLKSLFAKLSDKKRYSVRILHNLGALALGQGINTVGQLVTVPIFLYFWGKELYGEWLLLSTIPAYFAMNDLGFASAGMTEMTVLVARNERAAALEVFQSIWVMISIISLVLLMGLAAVLTWVPVARWLHIAHLTQGESTLLILLLLCHTAVSQQIGLIQAGFRCEGVVALGANWSNAIRMAELLLTAGVIAVGGKPLTIATVTVLTRTLGAVLIRIHLSRLYPWVSLGWRHARVAQIRRLAGPAFAFMGFPLGQALKNQGIVILIGRTLGPVGVVAFTTARTMTNVAFQFMGIIHNSVWPEMSAAFGAGDIHLAKGLHRNSCRASLWVSMAVVIGLFFLGGWAYRIWTYGRVELNQPLFHMLLLVVVANSLWYTSCMVPMAINCHQRTAFWFLVGTGLALVLAMWMLPHWGLVGAGGALLVIDVVMLLLVLPHSLALVDDRFADFALVVIKPPYRLAWRF